MFEDVSVSRIGKRSLTAKNHWEDLSFKKKYKIEKPTVFCFSGSGDVSKMSANGFCKLVENMLTLSFGNPKNVEEEVDIIGIAYGVTDRQSLIGNMEDLIGNMEEHELRYFIHNYMLPIVLNEDKTDRLPLETACKNMAKVSFFGFCHGCEEIQTILSKMKKILPKYGYEKDEIEKILGSTFSVSYAPETNDRHCPGVSVFSMLDPHNFGSNADDFEDYENMLGEDVDGLLLDIDKSGYEFGRKIKYVPERYEFDNIKIMSTKLLNEHEPKDEHPINILSRDANWNMRFYKDKNADCVSQMMSFAICEAVENSRKVCQTNEHSIVEIRELYKNLCGIELRGFKSEELKDRTR